MTTARYATAPTPGRAHELGQIELVARLLGTPLMPWQSQVARVASERLPSGRWAYPTVVVTVPRQSGKTTLMRAVLAQRAITRHDMDAFYTAQTGRDARERWKDLVKAVEHGPLSEWVETKMGAGDSRIVFTRTGSSVRPFAPTPKSLHGYTTPLVMIDEAFAHDQAAGTALMGAVGPAQITLPDRQLWIVSTAGDAGSTWLRSWVDRGRDASAGDGIAYFEWAADDDADAGNPDSWTFHPAVGHTITLDDIAGEHARMPPGEFSRAYLNRWTRTAEAIIDLDVWDGLALGAQPAPTGPVAFGYDIAQDRSHASLIAAWQIDGTAYGRVVESGPGVDWLAAHARAAREATPGSVLVATDAGPVRQITDELTRDGVPVTTISERDYATACGALVWRAKTSRLRHDGAVNLRAAVQAAATRPMSEAWGISRLHSTGPVDALIALAVAVRAADQTADLGAPVVAFG